MVNKMILVVVVVQLAILSFHFVDCGCLQFATPPKSEFAYTSKQAAAYFYEYSKASTGWFAVGFSSHASTEMLTRLTDVTLFIWNKSDKSVRAYMLPATDDWGNIMLMEKRVAGSIVSDSFFKRTGGTIDLKGSDPDLAKLFLPQNMKYIIMAKNSTDSEQLTPDTMYITEKTTTEAQTVCNNWYSIRKRQRLYFTVPTISFLSVLATIAVLGIVQVIAQIFVKGRQVIRRRLPMTAITTILIILVNVADMGEMMFDFMQLPKLAHICWGLSLAIFMLMFFVYLLVLARYLYIRYIYKIMMYYNKQNQRRKTISVHRWIASDLTFYFITLGVGLLLVILFIIIAVLTNEDLIFQRYMINLPRFIITLLVFLVVFSVLVADCVYYREMISSKGFFYYLLFDDPLGFRVEMLASILLPIGSGATALIVLAFKKNVSTLTAATYSNYIVFISIVAFVTMVQFVIYLAIIGGGAALLIDQWNHIVLLIRRKSKPDSTQSRLRIERDLIDNVANMELFEYYSMREATGQNVLLLKEILSIKENGASLQKLNHIIDMYLAPRSPMEVNISSGAKTNFLESVEELKQFEQSEIHWEVVESLYPEILDNIRDTYSRYQATLRLLNMSDYSNSNLISGSGGDDDLDSSGFSTTYNRFN